MFFFVKKNQKTFATAPAEPGAQVHKGRGLHPAILPSAAPGKKVFCFFFSKKKAFLPSSAPG